MPEFTFSIRKAKIFEGYGFGRRGCYAGSSRSLGMATDAKEGPPVAKSIPLEAWTRYHRRGLSEIKHGGASWLQSFGFTCSHPSLACIVAQIIFQDVPNDSGSKSGKTLNQKLRSYFLAAHGWLVQIRSLLA